MGYVCKTLTESDLNGLQTCLEWEAHTTLGLPDLSPQNAYELGYAILYVCTAAFCFKLMGILIKKFI